MTNLPPRLTANNEMGAKAAQWLNQLRDYVAEQRHQDTPNAITNRTTAGVQKLPQHGGTGGAGDSATKEPRWA